MQIDVKGLKYLLEDSSDKPWYMIQQVRRHLKIIESIEGEYEVDDNPSVDAVEFDKFHKMNINFALEDLWNNALKRPAFKKRLLRDIPEQKLGAKFKNGKIPPKTIRLPGALRDLLSPETLREIDDYWNEHFAGKTYLHHSDKDLKPKFIP